MAVVQMMKNAGSATFGELANKYFQLITAHLGNNGCNRVDVVFDRYDKEDSIKEAERARRGSSSSFEVRISDPSTPVPKKWQNFISNPVNKTNLKAFLGSTWKEMAKTRLAGDQKLVLEGCFIHSDDTFAITQNQKLLCFIYHPIMKRLTQECFCTQETVQETTKGLWCNPLILTLQLSVFMHVT